MTQDVRFDASRRLLVARAWLAGQADLRLDRHSRVAWRKGAVDTWVVVGIAVSLLAHSHFRPVKQEHHGRTA